MALRRRAEAVRSETPPAMVAASTVAPVAESTPPVTAEETTQPETAEMEFVRQSNEGERRGEKCPVDREAECEEDKSDKRPRVEESDLVLPFTIQPRIRNMSISSASLALRDPAVALSMASSISVSR